MKNNIARFTLLFLIIAVVFFYCKKDTRAIDLKITAVSNLFMPDDNAYIKLDPATGGTHVFSWDQARAEDGSLVLYEVAFDQANGDFSKPFYTVVSDNGGVQTQLTLTDGQLNSIAKLGGSGFFEVKKFKWTVLSSKGTNVQPATQSRNITLERPAGFDSIPGTLYLTGSATEGGDVLSKALKMKQTGAGTFEIYSKLKAGTYKFVDAVAGTPHVFYLYAQAGIQKLGIDSASTFSGADKIERITVNFNDVNGTITEIKSMKLWYGQANDFWFELPYKANGMWEYDGWTVELLSVPWGLEDRYKYKMVENDGTGDKDHWINSTFNDPPGQDGQYPSTEAYRTLNLTQNDGSQYDWGWKFDKTYLTQGSVANFWISLRGSDNAYTQNYQKQ